jgi:hypothetical protein
MNTTKDKNVTISTEEERRTVQCLVSELSYEELHHVRFYIYGITNKTMGYTRRKTIETL